VKLKKVYEQTDDLFEKMDIEWKNLTSWFSDWKGLLKIFFSRNPQNVTHGTTTLKSPEGVKNVYILGLHSRPCGLMFSMETVKMDFSETP
jgi:hypothetical protein